MILNGLVRKGLSGKVIFKQTPEGRGRTISVDDLRKNSTGRRDSKYQGSDAGVSLVASRNSQKASVAKVEGGRGRCVANEIK